MAARDALMRHFLPLSRQLARRYRGRQDDGRYYQKKRKKSFLEELFD